MKEKKEEEGEGEERETVMQRRYIEKCRSTDLREEVLRRAWGKGRREQKEIRLHLQRREVTRERGGCN